MQTIRSKKTTVDPATYAVLIRELNQAMTAVPKLKPDRDTWDIEGDWSSAGTIHFVDASYQSVFTPYSDFDCKSIKLANYGRPACRISFFQKFRYWVLKEKSLNKEEKTKWITSYINKQHVDCQVLQQKSQALDGSSLTKAKMKLHAMYEQIDTWQRILDNIDEVELAISNYENRKHYCTMNYKYFTDDSTYQNRDEHMLSMQRDRSGNITQIRYNIVFVNVDDIHRPHPYQHKEVHKFLAAFPLSTQFGRQLIYARPKVEPESLEEHPIDPTFKGPQQLDITFSQSTDVQK